MKTSLLGKRTELVNPQSGRNNSNGINFLVIKLSCDYFFYEYIGRVSPFPIKEYPMSHLTEVLTGNRKLSVKFFSIVKYWA